MPGLREVPVGCVFFEPWGNKYSLPVFGLLVAAGKAGVGFPEARLWAV